MNPTERKACSDFAGRVAAVLLTHERDWSITARINGMGIDLQVSEVIGSSSKRARSFALARSYTATEIRMSRIDLVAIVAAEMIAEFETGVMHARVAAGVTVECRGTGHASGNYEKVERKR